MLSMVYLAASARAAQSNSTDEIEDSMDDIRRDEKRNEPDTAPDNAVGELAKVAPADAEVEQFYGHSTTDAYRLKSELVGRCMEDIGMGRYSHCLEEKRMRLTGQIPMEIVRRYGIWVDCG